MQLFSADATIFFNSAKSWKNQPSKVAQKYYFFHPEQPKRPKKKNSFPKMWLIDQLYKNWVWNLKHLGPALWAKIISEEAFLLQCNSKGTEFTKVDFWQARLPQWWPNQKGVAAATSAFYSAKSRQDSCLVSLTSHGGPEALNPIPTEGQ